MPAKSKSHLRFLLDENISHETANLLKKIGHTVVTVDEMGLNATEDVLIFKFAAKYKYIVITFDLDFGYIVHQIKTYHSSVILLRLSNQTVESVNASLTTILKSKIIKTINHSDYFVVIDDRFVRIRKIR